MSKLIQFMFLALCAVNVNASTLLSDGFHDSFESKVLGEKRDYYIYLPPSYEKSKSKFPVVYVLDGDIHRWKAITGVVEGLSTETLGNQIQEAIVIAIPNTNRGRDLTPSILPEWTFEGKVLETFEYSGGALKFLQFLQKELIPHIELQYRASNKRVLVGESFGGLFAAYTLILKPEVFSDYLIIDPTALWDNDFLNREYKDIGFAKNHATARAYFAFANNTKLGRIGTTNQKWGQAFASKLESQASDQFKIKQNFYEQETHGTVAFLGWYHGLKFLLSNASD